MKRQILLIFALSICTALSACAKKAPSLDTKECQKAEGYFKLGISYMANGDSTSALESLLKAEELCPHDPEIQNAMGLVYYSKEKYDKSINHYQLALQHDPDMSDAAHNLGVVYLYLNRYDEAIALFKQALSNDLYRNQANSLNAIGWAYFKKRDFVQAEKHFRETLEHDRMYLAAYDNLARVYMALERYEDAIKELERALVINPFFAIARLDLGICYLKLDMKDKAKEQFRKVLEHDPLGKLGSQAQEYLNLLE